MSDFHNARVIVVGAGAFGSAIAFMLARGGARVVIVDPRPVADNASGIAAGMLAPAFEAVLDPVSAGHYSQMVAARDLWPDFAEAVGQTGLERCGALLRGPTGDLDRLAGELRDIGARCERVGENLFTPEDWRLEPRLILAALRRTLLLRRTGEVVEGEAVAADAHSVTLTDGAKIEGDLVVLACGYGGLGLAPELAALAPIKGQLLRFPDAGLIDGPILRSLLGYVVPSRDGAVAGATMEPGRDDLTLSRDALDRLKVEAGWLSPGLGLAHANGFAGVRAAAPDGLPLMGVSQTGAYLAAGARRNGWLYAPLAAAVVMRAIAGRPLPDDDRFAPGRFTATG